MLLQLYSIPIPSVQKIKHQTPVHHKIAAPWFMKCIFYLPGLTVKCVCKKRIPTKKHCLTAMLKRKEWQPVVWMSETPAGEHHRTSLVTPACTPSLVFAFHRFYPMGKTNWSVNPAQLSFLPEKTICGSCADTSQHGYWKASTCTQQRDQKTKAIGFNWMMEEQHYKRMDGIWKQMVIVEIKKNFKALKRFNRV